MRHFLAFLCIFILPDLGEAQARWDSYWDPETGENAAGVCPIEDAATGNVFCFALACSEEEPLGYRISVVGGDLIGRFGVGLQVDGTDIARLRFQERPAEGYASFTAPYEPGAHDAVIDALRAGSVATLSFEHNAHSQEMSLGGSSRAIAGVLENCPLPLPATPPVASPAADVRAQIAELCEGNEGPGRVKYGRGFVNERDFDGDGLMDHEIDWGVSQCDDIIGFFCGSAGCTNSIYRNNGDGTWTHAFTANYYGVEVVPGGQLVFSMHGSFCDRAGYEGCQIRYRWQDGQLVEMK